MIVTNRKRHTQKHRKTFWKNTNLIFMGSGSFGTIYQITQKNSHRAMKIHRLREGIETCEDWKREFLLQKEAYRLCTPLLHPFSTYIARPHDFSYGSWNPSSTTLTHHRNHRGATACFFTMDRIPGRLPETSHGESIYRTIAPRFHTKAYIPPYLFMGALQYQISAESNVVTLDMLADTELVEFPQETLTYCNILTKGIAEGYLHNITGAFFTLIEKGFLPRDVEFLLDPMGKIAIIDFNEVRRIIHFSVNEIAQVYIDLCGIRRKSDRNPYYPADEPTPQWKFLCNPLTCPRGFCSLLEKYADKSWQAEVLQEVLHYATRQLQTSSSTKADWNPIKPIFSSSLPITERFDMIFQQYIVSHLCELLHRRGIDIPHLRETEYERALSLLRTALDSNEIQEDTDDWANHPMWL
jgi:hypothetical protein